MRDGKPHLSEIWREMPYRLHWGWYVLAIVGLLAVTVAECVGPARADDRVIASPDPSPTPADPHPDPSILARVAAGEAGLAPGPDTAALHAVLLDRARRMGVSYERAAQLYSTRHLDRRATHPRRWVAWLGLDLERPRHWPRALSWSRHRTGWAALVEQARRVVTGRETAPCEPHHFGDRHGDARRARALGWTEVDCGETRDSYWRVPALERLDAS